jgi:NADPH:quinone reductase-like Zn-dependent oxidoreductase
VPPTDVTFAQAAASTEGGQYALSFIHTANVHTGQSVLVYGAIGSALVQRLMHTGAQVTAVCAVGKTTFRRLLKPARAVPRARCRARSC